MDRFNRFCEKIKDGKNMDNALVYAYFDIRSTQDLGEFWEKSLQDKARIKKQARL